MNMQQSKILTNIRKLNYKDLIIFLIPCIIFLYYLHVYDPGILTVDSYNQMHQISSGKFTNWHPFFHTFIEMLCIKLYPSTVSVAILQILTFSVFWTIICKYTRNESKEIDRLFILQAVITLGISFIPINAIYSITLWKDILFSYLLMFLCFLIKVLLDKEGQVSYTFVVIFSLVMAFLSQIRPNGIYIVIILMIVFGIYFFKKNETDRLYLVMPALTIIFILLIASLNVAYDVQDNQKDAVLTKVTHMLADYDLNLQLDPGDRDKIHQLISEKDIKDKYEKTYSDPMWGAANRTVFNANKNAYIGMAIKYSMQNPAYAVKYILDSSPMVWDITRDSDWIGTVYRTDINNANRFFYANNNGKPLAEYDGVMATNSNTDEYQKLNAFTYSIKDNTITDTLFDSPALYMYLAILAMIAIHLITKSKSIYLMYLPNLLNIIVVLLSTPIQDNRYLYANLLVFYLLLMILLGAIMAYKNKTDNDRPMNTSYNEVYPEPQINETTTFTQEETPEEMEARIRAKILKELEEEQKLRKK